MLDDALRRYRELFREGRTADADAVRRRALAALPDAKTVPSETVTGLQEGIMVSERDRARIEFDVARSLAGGPLF